MSDMWMAPNIPAMGGTSGFISNPGGSGLSQAQNSYNQNQNYFANQAATLNAANAYSPWANTPGGFGGQTAAYAGLGAAYGRGTGGFNAVGGVTQPVGTPGRPSSIGGGGAAPSGGSSYFDTGAPAVPYLSGGGMPFGGGGFGGRGGSVSPPPMQTQLPFQNYGLPGGGGMGAFSPSPNYPGGSRGSIAQSLMPPPPDFNHAFKQFGMSGPQMQTQDAFDTMRRFNGVGTGVAPDAAPGLPPSLPPTASEGGEGSFADRFSGAPEGGAGSSGSFADRFAPFMGGNPGTPSQYYTGDRYLGAQAPPPGYETLFSADNPSGALPVGGFRGLSQPPIMNASPDDELSGDTLTARDRAIGQGSGGGFYPTPFNPGQFAPSSPFGSGAGVGGRPGGSGGIGSGVGTQMPNTAPPFFGGEGSGFGAPGSTQSGGLYAGRRSPGVLGQMPGFIGTSQDAYGNPFIQGSAPPYELQGSRLGGGYGVGGLGQGTAFRGVPGR